MPGDTATTRINGPPPRTGRWRALALNLLALGVGLLVAVLLLEALLQFYNPFQARIKGNRIVLLTNKQYRIRNDLIPSLDSVVTVTRNAVGFRGPNPPANFADHLTMIAIGGSTTQSFFLSDDKTWPARLGHYLAPAFRNLWVNNAGLDGHSTYGHVVLLEDHIKKIGPKVVLFLIAANDIARGEGEEWDAENIRGRVAFYSPRAFVKSLSPYSEVAALIANLYRSLNAYRRGLMHSRIVLTEVGYADEVTSTREEEYVATFTSEFHIGPYRDRVTRLAQVAKAAGMLPVFLTQPLLAGEGTDDVTGVDLARVRVDTATSGRMWWRVLEKYNDVTRRVAAEHDAILVDVARELPKSSRMFYDFLHYTNEGADEVGRITARHLCPFLQRRYPEFTAASCGAL